METILPDYNIEVRRDVPRDFLIDVEEYFCTAAQQAEAAVARSHKAIDRGIAMGVRRRNQGVGLVRYLITDEIFEQLIARHGGDIVRTVEIEGRDGPKAVPLHLTTARFGATLVGFASHFSSDDLPIKNATRKALCAQNAGLARDLLSGLELYRDRERFVLIMVRRDRYEIGKIASIDIAIADRQISRFLSQVNIKEFLASYGARSTGPKTAEVHLKKGAGRLRGKGTRSERTGTE